MKELNFNDRVSYLAWKKEWFKAYKDAVAAIRAGKVAFKNEQRKVTVTFVDKYGGYYQPMYDEKPLDWRCKDYYKWYDEHPKLVKEIDELVQLRQQSRVKSGQQRAKMLDSLQLAA